MLGHDVPAGRRSAGRPRHGVPLSARAARRDRSLAPSRMPRCGRGAGADVGHQLRRLDRRRRRRVTRARGHGRQRRRRGNVAAAAAAAGAWIVHVSTDYVFDGDKRRAVRRVRSASARSRPTGARSSTASGPSPRRPPSVTRSCAPRGCSAPAASAFPRRSCARRHERDRADRGRRPDRLPHVHRPSRRRRWWRWPQQRARSGVLHVAGAGPVLVVSSSPRAIVAAAGAGLPRATRSPRAEYPTPGAAAGQQRSASPNAARPTLPDWRAGLEQFMSELAEVARMKLLVCGAAGFIGSTFVELRVREHGDEVTVLDALTYAGRRGEPARGGVRDPLRPGRDRGSRGGRRRRSATPRRSSTSPPRPTWTARSPTRSRSASPTARAPTCCSRPRASGACATCRSPPTRSTARSRPARSPRPRRCSRPAPTAPPRPAPTCSSSATSTPTG